MLLEKRGKQKRHRLCICSIPGNGQLRMKHIHLGTLMQWARALQKGSHLTTCPPMFLASIVWNVTPQACCSFHVGPGKTRLQFQLPLPSFSYSCRTVVLVFQACRVCVCVCDIAPMLPVSSCCICKVPGIAFSTTHTYIYIYVYFPATGNRRMVKVCKAKSYSRRRQ